MNNRALNFAQDALCIQSVNLRTSNSNLKDDVDVCDIERSSASPQSFKLVKQVREYEETKDDENIASWLYKFNYQIGIRLVPNNEEEQSYQNEDYEALIHIAAEFQACYVSKVKLDKTHLDAFSENNVGFNVWPYWRELVQSYCCRIGFHPPIEIPLYKSLERKPEEKLVSNEE